MASTIFHIINFFILFTLSFVDTREYALPAVFIFGDSLADVGNNNYVNTSINFKANFPPYGIDFPGKIPTGRFSNGYNTYDWIAQFVGHKQSSPAYCSITNETEMLNGVNFASGGSGILDTTGKSITLTEQIRNFKRVQKIIVRNMGVRRAYDQLSDALFLFASGSNDMFDYYTSSGPRSQEEYEMFASKMVNKLGNDLMEFYLLGARRFGFYGASMIGCIPAMRNANPSGECVEDLNLVARIFNKAFLKKLDQLQRVLPHMRFSYGNVYSLVEYTMKNPEEFPYKEMENACCGSGRFNGGGLCTTNATICSNRDEYMFWDWAHPSDKACEVTAISLYYGSYDTPISILELEGTPLYENPVTWAAGPTQRAANQAFGLEQTVGPTAIKNKLI